MVDSQAYKRIASDAMNRERNLPNLISSDYYWKRKRREVTDLIRRNSERFQDAKLFVELGCGRGRDIWAIRDTLDKPDLTFECVEASTESLELARARKAYHGVEDVTFKQCDITQPLPWKDDSVDIVYSSEVFEHIPNIEPLISEVERILKRGGHLILTTPNEPNLFQRSFYSQKRRQEIEMRNSEPNSIAEDGTPLYGHVTLKTNSEWDKLMATHGLELVDHGRRAVWYGGTDFHDSNFMLALQFALEGILDLLPRKVTRSISDQVIALYERQ